MSQKLNIFISYAHKDEDFKEALDTHLTMLKRSDKVNMWNDRAISAGTEWDAEIKQQLQDAHIIILLVSASFLASQYIWEQEISYAMQRHEARTARIIPVFIKPCDWKDAPFAKIQGLPRDAKPVGSAANDEAWAQVAQGIRTVVDDLLAKGVGATSKPDTNKTIQPQKPPTQQNQSSVIHQAITLTIQQDFAQAFALLDTLNLQNPLYYQLKREYTSGVYRNDPHYADRLITFLKSL